MYCTQPDGGSRPTEVKVIAGKGPSTQGLVLQTRCVCPGGSQGEGRGWHPRIPGALRPAKDSCHQAAAIFPRQAPGPV